MTNALTSLLFIVVLGARGRRREPWVVDDLGIDLSTKVVVPYVVIASTVSTDVHSDAGPAPSTCATLRRVAGVEARAELAQRAFERQPAAQHAGELLVHEREFI